MEGITSTGLLGVADKTKYDLSVVIYYLKEFHTFLTNPTTTKTAEIAELNKKTPSLTVSTTNLALSPSNSPPASLITVATNGTMATKIPLTVNDNCFGSLLEANSLFICFMEPRIQGSLDCLIILF